MSEQATMTREQLEAAGWDIYMCTICQDHKWWEAIAPEGPREGVRFIGTSDDAGLKDVLRRATAHHRQQQELAALREVINEINVMAEKALTARFTGEYEDILMHLAHIQGLSAVTINRLGISTTVSESERAE